MCSPYRSWIQACPSFLFTTWSTLCSRCPRCSGHLFPLATDQPFRVCGMLGKRGHWQRRKQLPYWVVWWNRRRNRDKSTGRRVCSLTMCSATGNNSRIWINLKQVGNRLWKDRLDLLRLEYGKELMLAMCSFSWVQPATSCRHSKLCLHSQMGWSSSMWGLR